jgi:ABC-type multidrug transport system ATPase subunit
MAKTVVRLLSDLSRSDGGRIVITCVHCPSSDLVTYFDSLLLLTHDGRLAYHGPCHAAISHFQNLG